MVNPLLLKKNRYTIGIGTRWSGVFYNLSNYATLIYTIILQPFFNLVLIAMSGFPWRKFILLSIDFNCEFTIKIAHRQWNVWKKIETRAQEGVSDSKYFSEQ